MNAKQLAFVIFIIFAFFLSVGYFIEGESRKEPDPIWEKVNKYTYRMEVEGGWIYETLFDGKKGMVFVPKTSKEGF